LQLLVDCKLLFKAALENMWLQPIEKFFILLEFGDTEDPQIIENVYVPQLTQFHFLQVRLNQIKCCLRFVIFQECEVCMHCRKLAELLTREGAYRIWVIDQIDPDLRDPVQLVFHLFHGDVSTHERPNIDQVDSMGARPLEPQSVKQEVLQGFAVFEVPLPRHFSESLQVSHFVIDVLVLMEEAQNFGWRPEQL
jgi:hypothetical protein